MKTFTLRLAVLLTLVMAIAWPTRGLGATEGPKRLRVVLVSFEPEYDSAQTLPGFAQQLSDQYGCNCTVLLGKEGEGIPGLEKLAAADLLVLYVRRHALPSEQMAMLHRYLDSGKPLVALRTSCHAFDIKRPSPHGMEQWTAFDHEVLGGNYHDHYMNPGEPVTVAAAPNASHSPILAGVPLAGWSSHGTLYKVSPVASDAAVLLLGTYQKHTEPVAWTHTYHGGRVFFTTLGHPDDFDSPSFRRLLVNAVFWAMDKPAPNVPAAPRSQVGRPVKVATIAIGCGGDHEKKLKLALEHLEAAGQANVAIACLPEEFSGTKAEPIPGPTTKAVGALAKKYHMYVVCPIRELASEGRQYNTAVLLDRRGNPVGSYRKVFPFWNEKGVSLGRDVPVFDTDFGRIAMLICFDANFDELWQQAERKGAEMVFWPSAYGGGMPLNGYAMIHSYYIVATGFGDVIDLMGKNVSTVGPLPQQFLATVDLDLTIVHQDFNKEKVERLLGEQKGKIELLSGVGAKAGWYVLRAVAPGVRVADLCKQYKIETLREYRHRSRQQLDALRAADKPL